jgi:predicted nucleotidyltransferase/uncharacterized protein (UPF0332 family)
MVEKTSIKRERNISATKETLQKSLEHTDKKGSKKQRLSLKKKKIGPKKNKQTSKKFPTLNLKTENEIAMDFATKAYKKFEKAVKSIILFGSTVKQTTTQGSDIDIIILIDDASIKWDQEMIAWYREELEKILKASPYQQDLHITTVKLSTWWQDLMRGDPVVINILRYGEAIIDFGGFFDPLKYLLIEGKIKSTPEAVYSCLQRAPTHLMRSRVSELGAIEGLYWAMVDSAHAALIASNVSPPSPEHIPVELKEVFVNEKKLDIKYVVWYRDLHILHKKIAHGEIRELKGVEIDDWQEKAEDFVNTMAKLVDETFS